MFSSGLKLHIAGTLVFLLTIAILLGNVVVVMFWQKGLVRSEIEHVRSIMEFSMSSHNYTEYRDDSVIYDSLKDMCHFSGTHCVGGVFFDGRRFVDYELAELTGRIKSLARTAALSQSEVVRLNGNTWGVFSLGKRFLLIAKPVSSKSKGGPSSVALLTELGSIYEIIKEDQKKVFVYLLVNVLFLSVVGFFRLIKITVKPLERIVKISESYRESDGLLFRGEQNHSEFGQLTVALNSMLLRIELDRETLRKTVNSLETANKELLKTQKDMIRAEKLASVGRLSAGLAHEIGNPIGIVQGYIELLQQADISEPERIQFAQRALGELDRVNKLIRQLLDFAGSSGHEMSPVHLDEFFEGLIQITTLEKSSSAVSLVTPINTGLTIKGDQESLRQVFLNCLLNALDAIQARGEDWDGRIAITAEKISEGSDGQSDILIKIEDNGTGIENQDLDVVFDPFFTTKAPGKGTGLGLFVSHSIIEAHGGRMWVESEIGKGSTVNMKLPGYEADNHSEHNEPSDH